MIVNTCTRKERWPTFQSHRRVEVSSSFVGHTTATPDPPTIDLNRRIDLAPETTGDKKSNGKLYMGTNGEAFTWGPFFICSGQLHFLYVLDGCDGLGRFDILEVLWIE